MRTTIKWSLIILGVVVLGAVIMIPAGMALKERNRIQYREVEVTRGKIVAVVNATGTVKPVRSVAVGTFVSGPILRIPTDDKGAFLADFTKEVTKGQLLAEIDPAIYQAAVDRDTATVKQAIAAHKTRLAELKQAHAQMLLAQANDKRAGDLANEKKGFISAQEVDQFRFTRQSLEAAHDVAKANVDSAEANVAQTKALLKTSQANLDYTKILAPENGIVIDRKVDPGQTVAATFQTPDLFVIAPNMRQEIFVHASVDETDIGLIADAKENNLPVRFTVDSYPDDLFEGKIFQVRQNATTNQNVVTYPVIVSAGNQQLKLRPGMTANVSFQIGERVNKLRIPNAALRFFPQRDQVRPEDRKILEGAMHVPDPDEQAVITRSAEEKAELRRLRSKRHVWVNDGDHLRAVEVIVGLSDSRFTEIVSSTELIEGSKLVTGIQPRN